jgi:hypothetical protein
MTGSIQYPYQISIVVLQKKTRLTAAPPGGVKLS